MPRFDKHANAYACKLYSRVGPVESRAGRKSPRNLDAKLGLSSGGGSPAIYPNWTTSCFLPARSRTIYRSPKGHRLIKEKPRALWPPNAPESKAITRCRETMELGGRDGSEDQDLWPHPMHQRLRSHGHSPQ